MQIKRLAKDKEWYKQFFRGILHRIMSIIKAEPMKFGFCAIQKSISR